MKIGILGAGHVGKTLGERWAKAGHLVVFGVRDPAAPKVKEMLSEAGANACADVFWEAAAYGEVVVLAVSWPAAEQALKDAGDLSGKILLDVTNPFTPDLAGLEVGLTTSAAEKIKEWAPGARVVKIFNTTGAGNMANPQYGETRITMLYCGDDADAKRIAASLAADIGFSPVDAGPLKLARVLEPLALLWVSLAFGGLGNDFAFQLVRRQ